MKTFSTLLLGLCLCSPLLTAQVEHAPTVEQCRADQRLWLPKLEGERNLVAASSELNGWRQEMNDCMKVDPAFSDRYYSTTSEAGIEKLLRLEHFLYRHNLYDSFLAEDAHGQR